MNERWAFAYGPVVDQRICPVILFRLCRHEIHMGYDGVVRVEVEAERLMEEVRTSKSLVGPDSARGVTVSPDSQGLSGKWVSLIFCHNSNPIQTRYYTCIL